MGADAPWHWVILGIVVIALFGYKKLPDAARAAGRSLRIFKTEIKGMTEDDKARAAADKPETVEVAPAAPEPASAAPSAPTAPSDSPAPRTVPPAAE